MNPETPIEALSIAKKSDHENAIIIPPFIFLDEVGRILKKAKLGAQDIFYKEIEKGPFTGEVSAKELLNIGVEYVIIGHSERRAMGETDELVSQKMRTALDVGLIPILCIGESLEEHKNGTTKEKISRQITKALSNLPSLSNNSNLIIAYEPIWAIGSGNSDTPENAAKILRYIKDLIKNNNGIEIKTFYGGSVTPENITSFLNKDEVDGVLIGGASLKPD
ncbi:MAG: triose-phosphate isomerase, partial [Patescibacteria group bacterium]|nr:triose-phosphate isomerase [Patescibacteria group bacterium]